MHIGNPQYFWLIFLLPAFAILAAYKLKRRKETIAKFADIKIIPLILPDYLTLFKRHKFDCFRLVLIFFLLIAAVLRPQQGFKWSEAPRSGVDIAIAVDISESMLAEDITPNRLERSRRELIDLLSHLKGDRVSLITFAGIAFIETPLTLDYATFRAFLDDINPNLAPIQGTNIEAAFGKSLEALQVNKEGFNKNNSHAIILITDGEDFEGNFEHLALQAKENNIPIYIIGIGTKEGSPIPTKNGYKKDKSGNVVITKLNEQTLAQLATKTGGIYVSSITSDQDTVTIYEQGIKKVLTDNSLTNARAKIWNEYFQYPLLIALMIFLLPYIPKLNKNLLFILFCILLTNNNCSAESSESLGAKAKDAYNKSDYSTALDKFTTAEEKSKTDYRLSIGRGASLYRLRNYQEAYSAFYEALSKTTDPILKAQALYNAGNSLVQTNKLQEAVNTYEESLKLNPNDREAKDNLEYAKRLLKEQQNQQKQDQNKDNSEKNNSDNLQQQQQNQNQQNENKSKKNEDKNSQQKPEQNPNETSTQSSAIEQNNTNSSLQSLLGSIEEKKDSLIKYRLEQAEEQLKQHSIEPPEKDW